jgi:hypothetical protein
MAGTPLDARTRCLRRCAPDPDLAFNVWNDGRPETALNCEFYPCDDGGLFEYSVVWPIL